MKKLLALIFLTSISSPAVAMPAIFGMRMTNSVFVPSGVSVNFEDGSGGVTTITSPGDSGDTSIIPNPIDVMPVLPDGFVLPPVGILPDPGNAVPIPGSTGGNEAPFASFQMLENATPMPRGGRKI